VKALPWPARGGGGRLLVVGVDWTSGEGTAPGWGGGGTASCGTHWVARVGVGCAKGVAPGTAGAAGCAWGWAGGGPLAAVVMPASALVVLVGSS
jgi:hypothetical protein